MVELPAVPQYSHVIWVRWQYSISVVCTFLNNGRFSLSFPQRLGDSNTLITTVYSSRGAYRKRCYRFLYQFYPNIAVRILHSLVVHCLDTTAVITLLRSYGTTYYYPSLYLPILQYSVYLTHFSTRYSSLSIIYSYILCTIIAGRYDFSSRQIDFFRIY